MPSRKDGPPSIWDTHGFFGKRFLQIHRCVFHSTLSSRNWIHGVLSCIGTDSHHQHADEEWESKHQFKIRDASPDRQPKIQSSLVREDSFKELWSRWKTTADFRSSFWQIHHTSNVCLLEDKIQDWGMYLFTISYGSYALDQRSGDGWFSGWCKKIRAQ